MTTYDVIHPETDGCLGFIIEKSGGWYFVSMASRLPAQSAEAAMPRWCKAMGGRIRTSHPTEVRVLREAIERATNIHLFIRGCGYRDVTREEALRLTEGKTPGDLYVYDDTDLEADGRLFLGV